MAFMILLKNIFHQVFKSLFLLMFNSNSWFLEVLIIKQMAICFCLFLDSHSSTEAFLRLSLALGSWE